MKYKALFDLFYPTDPEVVQRLHNGENLPMRKRGMKHVAAGTIVDDLPEVSIPVLLAKGKIVAVDDGIAARLNVRRPREVS